MDDKLSTNSGHHVWNEMCCLHYNALLAIIIICEEGVNWDSYNHDDYNFLFNGNDCNLTYMQGIIA